MCSDPGCKQGATSKGLCPKHYQRLRTHGDTSTLLRAPNGSGSITPTGYRASGSGGNFRLQHRVVWESIHGPIPKGLVIHHINGDRLDNRIANLQALTISAHMHLHHPKVLTACSMSGCATSAVARNLCSAHYQEWRHNRTDVPRCRCCSKAAVVKGLCNTHYAAERRIL